MNVKIDGLNNGKLVEAVVEIIARQVVEQIRVQVEEEVRERVDAAVGALTTEAIRPVLAEVLEEGWQKTDQWGQPNGPRITLKDRLSQAVTAAMEERGRFEQGSPVQKMITEAVHQALAADVGKDIERARVAIRAQVDGLLNAKLREAVASAVGMSL